METNDLAELKTRVSELESELAGLRKLLGIAKEAKFAEAKLVRPKVSSLLMLDEAGKHRCELFVSAGSGACFHLCDAEGRPRVAMSTGFENEPAMVLLGEDAVPRVHLTVSKDAGFAQLGSAKEVPEITLQVNKNGGGEVALGAGGEKWLAKLSSDEKGGSFRLFRPDGTTMGGLTETASGPMFVTCDSKGHPRMMAGTTEHGGMMNLSDAKGQPAISLLQMKEGPTMSIGAPSGDQPSIMAMVTKSGPAISLSMQGDGSKVAFSAEKNGGCINLDNAAGENVARLRSGEKGHGELLLSAPDGSNRVMAQADVSGGQFVLSAGDTPRVMAHATAEAGNITLTDEQDRLRILATANGGTGTPVIAILDPAQHEVVMLCHEPDASGEVLLRCGEDAVSARLSAQPRGGAVILSNELGMSRASLGLNASDGGLLELEWAGTRAIAVASSEDGGRVIAFGKDGKEIKAIFPLDEPTDEE